MNLTLETLSEADLLPPSVTRRVAGKETRGSPSTACLNRTGIKRSVLLCCVGLAVATQVLRAAETPGDFYNEGRAALRAGKGREAASLLSKVPEDDSRFARAMILAGEKVYAEALNQPATGLALVEKAWRKFPDQRETTLAYLRCELLARTNLTVPFVDRRHPTNVPSEFSFIAAAPDWPDRSRTYPRARLCADLDALEVLLANAYAYAERRGANWRGALDAVRASLDEDTPLNTFSWRLSRAFTLFGDPHSAIRTPLTNFYPEGAAPFIPVSQGNRVLALKSDRSAFLDDACPYLEEIDGKPVSEWLRVAGFDVPQASPQTQRAHQVAALRRLNYLRAQLHLPLASNVALRVSSEDGQRHKDLSVGVPSRASRPSGWPRTRTETRDGIGILRIAKMSETPAFVKELDDAMNDFRDTRGLVIDVRQNGGGTQDALCTLLPYFMKPDAPMKIVNVAAYRMPARIEHIPSEGFLPAYRRLFPSTSTNWTAAERTQIESFLANFHHDWKLPAGFSGWHVMAVSHATNPKAFYYDRPVVILSDAGGVSATDNFLGAFKGHPKVTLLGTASAGASGRMADYVLPGTHLPLTLCQMASFRATGELYDGRGVPPDVVLEPKPGDYLKGSDSVLEAALLRLRNQAK
jgi:hypothetical protein